MVEEEGAVVCVISLPAFASTRFAARMGPTDTCRLCETTRKVENGLSDKSVLDKLVCKVYLDFCNNCFRDDSSKFSTCLYIEVDQDTSSETVSDNSKTCHYPFAYCNIIR